MIKFDKYFFKKKGSTVKNIKSELALLKLMKKLKNVFNGFVRWKII
jgi:hypothetical protein